MCLGGKYHYYWTRKYWLGWMTTQQPKIETHLYSKHFSYFINMLVELTKRIKLWFVKRYRSFLRTFSYTLNNLINTILSNTVRVSMYHKHSRDNIGSIINSDDAFGVILGKKIVVSMQCVTYVLFPYSPRTQLHIRIHVNSILFYHIIHRILNIIVVLM